MQLVFWLNKNVSGVHSQEQHSHCRGSQTAPCKKKHYFLTQHQLFVETCNSAPVAGKTASCLQTSSSEHTLSLASNRKFSPGLRPDPDRAQHIHHKVKLPLKKVQSRAHSFTHSFKTFFIRWLLGTVLCPCTVLSRKKNRVICCSHSHYSQLLLVLAFSLISSG